MKIKLPAYLLLLVAGVVTHSYLGFYVSTVTAQSQQSEKELIFKEFSEKRRSDPKEAYRVARNYMQKFGNVSDENTKYVSEWVAAYEAVMARSSASATDSDSSATTPPTLAANAAVSATKTLDLNGTTWLMQGKENGKPWAEIFSFKAGGKFQYEQYGVDGSSNILAGTWRKLGANIFTTLLGADGNPVGTVRAELSGGCLTGTLTRQGNGWQFMMEMESVPDGCRQQRQIAGAEKNSAMAAATVTKLNEAPGTTSEARAVNTAQSIWLLHAHGTFTVGFCIGKLELTGDGIQFLEIEKHGYKMPNPKHNVRVPCGELKSLKYEVEYGSKLVVIRLKSGRKEVYFADGSIEDVERMVDSINAFCKLN